MPTSLNQLKDYLSKLSLEELAELRRRIYLGDDVSAPEAVSEPEEYKKWAESLKGKSEQEILEAQREEQGLAEQLARSKKAAQKPLTTLGEAAQDLQKAKSASITSPARESAKVFEAAESTYPKSYAEKIVESASKAGKTAEEAAEILAPKELPAIVTQPSEIRRAAAAAKAASAAEGAASAGEAIVPSYTENLPMVITKAAQKSPFLASLIEKYGVRGIGRLGGGLAALAGEGPELINELKKQQYREATERLGGVAGGLVGAELGGGAGALVGLPTTGPGAVLTGLGGGILGYNVGSNVGRGLTSSALEAVLGPKQEIPVDSGLSQKRPDYEDDSNIEAQKREERRMRRMGELASLETEKTSSEDTEQPEETEESPSIDRIPFSSPSIDTDLLKKIMYAKKREEGQKIGEAFAQAGKTMAEGISAGGAPLGKPGVSFAAPDFTKAMEKVTEAGTESASSAYEAAQLLKKQKEEADERDPSSPLSKFYRDSFKTMGFSIPENASASLLKQILPQATEYVKTQIVTQERKQAQKEKSEKQSKEKAQAYVESAGKAIQNSKITQNKSMVDANLSGIQNALDNPNGISDIGVLYGFIKSLDPRSTVRPSEVELATEAINLFDEIGIKTSNFTSNKRVLTNELISKIKRLVEIAKHTADTQYKNMVDIATKNAVNRGYDENEARIQLDILNRDKLIMEEGQPSSVQSTPSKTTPSESKINPDTGIEEFDHG